MKKLLAALLAVSGLSVPVHAQQGQPNSYERTTVETASFDRLAVSGPFRVTAMMSEGPSEVVLTGPPELLADTIAEVEDGRLTVRFRDGARWSWNPGSGMHVFVRTPSLTSAELDGSGSIEIFGVETEAFAASTAGAGSITLRRMEVGSASFATAGAGGIIAEGRASEGHYVTAGAGSIDAKRLRVANANISVAGSGSVHADVSEFANVVLASSGSADIVGGARCASQEHGSGRVECR